MTIAGSDSGGGAGIQADLKTFSALGVFGTSAITAITAQNLDGVTAIQGIQPEVISKQMLAILEGFPIKAIKTGMLFSKEIIVEIVRVLDSPAYRSIPLVVDPVFAATSGSKLIQDEGIELLKESLLPMATVITPNIPEAEILTGLTITNPGHMKDAGEILFHRYGCAVLMKGGHLKDRALDILIDGDGTKQYEFPLVKGVNNHGSGCTLASAIAAAMARGEELRKAVDIAKVFINNSLNQSLSLSPGINVMNHFH